MKTITSFLVTCTALLLFASCSIDDGYEYPALVDKKVYNGIITVQDEEQTITYNITLLLAETTSHDEYLYVWDNDDEQTVKRKSYGIYTLKEDKLTFVEWETDGYAQGKPFIENGEVLPTGEVKIFGHYNDVEYECTLVLKTEEGEEGQPKLP